MRTPVHALLLAGVFALAGCGSSPTTPTTTTTTTTTTVAPTTTEIFSDVLPVGGSKFYSFTTSQSGTVNITLTAVSGQFVPSTVMMGLGIGQPSGTTCTTTTTVNAAAGATAQISGTYAAGLYCAEIHDLGNLFAPASFSVQIDYP